MSYFNSSPSSSSGSSQSTNKYWTPTDTSQQSQSSSNSASAFAGSIFNGVVGAAKNFAANPVQGVQKAAEGTYNVLAKGSVDLGKGAVSGAASSAEQVGSLAAALYHGLSGNSEAAVKDIKAADTQFHQSYFYNTVLKPLDQSVASKGQTASAYAEGIAKGLGSTGEMALNAVIAGGAAKVGEAGAKAGLSTALKQGAATGAKYGAAGGAVESLKSADANPTHVVENVAGGAAAGAVLGGGLGGGGHAINAALDKALTQFDHMHLASLANQDHATPQPTSPIPTPAAQPRIAATSSASPKQTAGPNPGVFGLHDVSPHTQQQLDAMGHIIHAYKSEGPRTDQVGDIAKIQMIRNQAASVMENLAADRFSQLKGNHDMQLGDARMLMHDVKSAGGLKTDQGIKGDMASVPLHIRNNNGFTPDDMAAHVLPAHGHQFNDGQHLLDSIAQAKDHIQSQKSDEHIIQQSHSQLATGSDMAATKYQQAAKVAVLAEAKYRDLLSQHKVTDVYHPDNQTPQAEAKLAGAQTKLTEATAQAGKERIGQATPQHSADTTQHAAVHTLLAQHDKASGANTVGQIKVLNQLIEHPDVGSAAKQHFIAEREALKPGAAKEAAQPKVIASTVDKELTSPTGGVNKPGTSSAAKPSVSSQAAKVSEPVLATAGKANKGILEKGMDKLTRGSLKGVGNPSRTASREGNIPLAKAAQEGVANKNVRTLDAATARKEFDRIAGKANRDDINRVIEGGATNNRQVRAAADYFIQHRETIGKEASVNSVIKGQKENYLPHVATGMEGQKTGASGNNLSKNTRFNTERQSIEHTDATGKVVKEDRYKTIGEFDRAVQALGGKAERDTGKLLEHMLTSEGHAVENAKTVDRLASAGMTDGRPALVKSTAKMDDSKYKGYVVIDNKLIHPDAVKLYQAISSNGRMDNELGAMLARINSVSKRLVTLNGMAHAMNIFKSSIGGQGFPRAVFAVFAPEKGAADVRRAVGYGLPLARASGQNIFDEYGKQTGFLGKVSKVMEPLDKALFDHFGDRQGLSTYFKIEKQMLKRGLTQDEAGRIAADAGGQVMHLVPKDQQSTTVRSAGQLALFATQFLHNTLKTGTNAVGVGLDKTLSQKAVSAQQRVAIERVGRMFGYMFAGAQVINLAATGKFTWENGNGDPLNPIWYKNGSKEYKISNHYGQLKDLYGFLTSPVTETTNKLSWGPREFAQQISNQDLFTKKSIVAKGDTGFNAAYDRLLHGAGSLFTPGGVDLSGKPNTQPALVQAAKFVGINSASAEPLDPNFDPAKYNADKTIAANKAAEQHYVDSGGSKLGWMQSMKLAGNSYYDKFFQANPQLDPTSSNFQGVQGGGTKSAAYQKLQTSFTNYRAKVQASAQNRQAKYQQSKLSRSLGGGKGVSSRPAKFTRSSVASHGTKAARTGRARGGITMPRTAKIAVGVGKKKF